MFRVLLILALILVSTISISLATGFPKINSKYLEIYDLTDNKILYEIDSNKEVPIASLTKIATIITAIENIEYVDEEVVITQEIINTLDDDVSIAGLKVGDRVTYRDLLYASMVPSGADAVHAIAILKFGSLENLLEMTNELVVRIGLSNTHFTNLIGLTESNHYSTADEVRKLLVYALDNPLFKEIYSTKKYRLSNGLKIKSTLYKYNMLKRDIKKIIGSKTGFTSAAGYCMAALTNVNGHEVIIVTLGAGRNGKKFYNVIDTIAIIDYLSENKK
ncbi:MAG: D-alanyl-D-alanine carboxypeptidase [Clostridia bacterium]|nr:D-alanyl-D-alanine carboxypeptidase [Clostridia bacterium]